MADDQSTADKLALHNQAVLVASAQKKLAAGKRLSRQELSAVEDAEREANKKRGLAYWKKMPKGDFLDEVGGSSKVFIEWHKKHGFPWPEQADHVDALAILQWLREAFVKRGAFASDADDAIYKRVRREREEFRFACEKREYIHIDEVNRILDMAAAAVRATCDGYKDRAFADLLTRRLHRAEEEVRRELTHVNGNGSTKRGGNRSR